MEKLTKLENDISYVSALSDYPNSNDGLTSTQLKETFDKGNNDIKDFINTTLTEEIDSKFATVPEVYATKEELANVQAGQIIDGTITYEKLSEDVQNKVKEADKVKPIYKYHKLGNPTVTKSEDGKYINNFELPELVENPEENLKFSVEFPNADEKQNGTDYYTADGYRINAENVESYDNGVDKVFDGNEETSCILTSSDTIILTLPEAKTFTKIKTFITADNLENIIYKGSNNKEEWTNLGVVSTADTELTEHTFSLSDEYLHYGIEINVTEGTATIYDIQFEEDENIPNDWILGTENGIINTDTAEYQINGNTLTFKPDTGKKYDCYFKNNYINKAYETVDGINSSRYFPVEVTKDENNVFYYSHPDLVSTNDIGGIVKIKTPIAFGDLISSKTVTIPDGATILKMFILSSAEDYLMVYKSSTIIYCYDSRTDTTHQLFTGTTTAYEAVTLVNNKLILSTFKSKAAIYVFNINDFSVIASLEDDAYTPIAKQIAANDKYIYIGKISTGSSYARYIYCYELSENTLTRKRSISFGSNDYNPYHLSMYNDSCFVLANYSSSQFALAYITTSTTSISPSKISMSPYSAPAQALVTGDYVYYTNAGGNLFRSAITNLATNELIMSDFGPYFVLLENKYIYDGSNIIDTETGENIANVFNAIKLRKENYFYDDKLYSAVDNSYNVLNLIGNTGPVENNYILGKSVDEVLKSNTYYELIEQNGKYLAQEVM